MRMGDGDKIRNFEDPETGPFKLQVGSSQLQVPRVLTQTCQQYVTEKKRGRHQFLQVSQFPSSNGRPSPQLSNGKLRRKSATVPMTRPARGAQAARPGTLHAASDSPGSPGRFLQWKFGVLVGGSGVTTSHRAASSKRAQGTRGRHRRDGAAAVAWFAVDDGLDPLEMWLS
ncbi:hypothetical protein BKA56DRAFT_613603 [Ilyonectria sp. MPI-CAGE-AT-0026]|nr:hypothetical protein BKA56DRAFT_613603 [Ilyonectria sp. MPI-CAGE-AT-0026]